MKKNKLSLKEMIDEAEYSDIFGMDAMNNLDDKSWDSKEKNLKGLSGRSLGQALMAKVREVVSLEQSDRDELEMLAVQIVKEAYPVIDYAGINIIAKIEEEPTFDNEEEVEIEPDNDEENKDEEAKRRIINGITQGGSQRGTFNYMMYKDYLDAINPELVSKYDDMLKLVFGQFDEDSAIMHMKSLLSDNDDLPMGGVMKVAWNDEGEDLTIHASAICFPMLVHEIVKGLYEILSLQGFGTDIEKNKQIVKKVDKLDNEPEDMRYGKFIYDAINKIYIQSQIDDPRVREYLFTEIYKLDNSDFLSFIENAINNELTSEQKKWAFQAMKDIERDLNKDDTGLDGL